ncbi:hypothetical protein MA03_06250 [Infirmifilum uzonense]|uniref:DUF1512 domain-containing protein n=1 Tax=Infirmifilum uzonense TaxID=1550241 RepID=A0A0F7FIZ9_9CREN|nr:DUF1512 domain-containing protein [Infirmifilum uzonense]AKG38928.1 hypothetical protein MA03_06250 [Infirmifilum uzonense]
MNGDTYSLIMWIIVLMFFSFLTQEMQIFRAISEVENYLIIFRETRDKSLKLLAAQLKRYSGIKDDKTIETKVTELVETYTILPVDLDPFGIVKKIKHIVQVGEKGLEERLHLVAPTASRDEILNLSNLVEVARALNIIYKQVNHYYLIARRFKSLWLLMQLSAQMPFVLEGVRAIEGALESFKYGVPIGDSAGPLVASYLVRKNAPEKRPLEPVKDTEVYDLELDNKKVYVVKAKGPGGTVGHLDEALQWILERTTPTLIITIDAALKYEGEESGSLAYGYGVAMGGIGAERFIIEELATKNNIPLYALLIKMSEAEALSVMTENIYKGVKNGLQVLEEFIRGLPAGSVVVVIGVGNTVGVP